MVIDSAHDVHFGEETTGEPFRYLVEPGGYDPIPPSLKTMEPGPVLAAFLDSIDVTKVSGFDQIVVLQAHDRMASHYGAARYRDIAAVVDSYISDEGHSPTEAGEATAAEVRAALHLTRRAADVEVVFAQDLKSRLPRLRNMLTTGVVDVRRAKVIQQSTMHLSDARAQAVVDEVATEAQRLTTGELAARIRRLCIEVDPNSAKERYDQAHADRRIVTRPSESSTVHLTGYDLAPDHVAAIMSSVNQMATQLHGSDGETRTMDQLRADVFLDLLSDRTDTKGESGNLGGTIDLVVDLDTLAGLNNDPGELGGYGPVIADVARQIAANHKDAEWRLSTLHPVTGDRIHIGTTSRRPTADQRRRIETRNSTCVFPGCRMPAPICDLDHIKAVQDGGETCDCNLAPLCRHDHGIKHAFQWEYNQPPNGGYEWVSPLGHTYRSANRAPPTSD